MFGIFPSVDLVGKVSQILLILLMGIWVPATFRVEELRAHDDRFRESGTSSDDSEYAGDWAAQPIGSGLSINQPALEPQ